jgi:hypothetical protein
MNPLGFELSFPPWPRVALPIEVLSSVASGPENDNGGRACGVRHQRQQILYVLHNPYYYACQTQRISSAPVPGATSVALHVCKECRMHLKISSKSDPAPQMRHSKEGNSAVHEKTQRKRKNLPNCSHFNIHG